MCIDSPCMLVNTIYWYTLYTGGYGILIHPVITFGFCTLVHPVYCRWILYTVTPCIFRILAHPVYWWIICIDTPGILVNTAYWYTLYTGGYCILVHPVITVGFCTLVHPVYWWILKIRTTLNTVYWYTQYIGEYCILLHPVYSVYWQTLYTGEWKKKGSLKAVENEKWSMLHP